MKRSTILKSILSVASFVPVCAWADDGATAAADTDRVIVVTGHGLDQTLSAPAYDVITLERETIVSSASGRIEDVLTNVAGFQQFRRSESRSANPSAQGATLRAIGGNATSRALVLLDGVPMADPFFGYIPFSALVPEQLARVRVTRGGGGGAFGAGAVAGTIELESAGAETIGLASGSMFVNNRGGTEASASFAPEIGQGFAVVSGRWDRGKGFYTTPRDQRVAATSRAEYESWSLSGRVVQPIGNSMELQARAMTWDDNRTLRFDGADNSSKGTDASLRLVGRGDWQFDVLGYAQWRNFTNTVISSTRFVPVLDQRDTPSRGLGGKIEVRPPLGEGHVLRLGADYRRSRGNLDEVAISAFSGNPTAFRRAGGTNTDLGLFAEYDWATGPLILTIGGRLDRWTIRNGYFREVDNAGVVQVDNRFDDRSGWEPGFRGGATVDLGRGWKIRAAAYRGLRLPTLNELYRPFVVFPVVTQANAALDLEKLRGFEAGLDWTPVDPVSLSFTAFDNKVKGAIANVTLEENLRQRRNVGAIRAKGLELGMSAKVETISFAASLVWVDAQVEDDGAAVALDGMRPAQTPRWAASGTFAWRLPSGWEISATLRHIGMQFEDDMETDRLPAATTLDMFARMPLVQGIAAILRAENLFDETVVTRNQSGSMDLGAPRTVWMGVRASF